MANTPSTREEISSAQAVLLGALAPGVNGPTWNTLKTAFMMLGLCLAVMLGLAFSSNDSYLVLHVVFLVLITATLFLLLSCFETQYHIVGFSTRMCLLAGFQDLEWLQAINFMIRGILRWNLDNDRIKFIWHVYMAGPWEDSKADFFNRITLKMIIEQ